MGEDFEDFDDFDVEWGSRYVDWDADLDASPLTTVLRESLSDDYSGATDEELDEALERVFDAMSPDEALNVAGVLSQIGRTTAGVLSDPTLSSVAQTALPIAGTGLGSMAGGPIGGTFGGQLGKAAASALQARVPQRPAATGSAAVPPAPVTPRGGAQSGLPLQVAGEPLTPPSVAGGSTAAAQALALANQPQILQSLLATALGQHGRQEVGGVQVSQLLGLLSHVIGQAAADADELMYLRKGPDSEPGLADPEEVWRQSLYSKLLDSDADDYEGSGW